MPSVKNPKIILVDPYISSIPGLGLAYLAAYLRKYLQIKDIKILKRNYSLRRDFLIKKFDNISEPLDNIYPLLRASIGTPIGFGMLNITNNLHIFGSKITKALSGILSLA